MFNRESHRSWDYFFIFMLLLRRFYSWLMEEGQASCTVAGFIDFEEFHKNVDESLATRLFFCKVKF